MSTARNAIFVYARTVISMIVGIYSVRFLLEALGVDDYGLLNVAGASLGLFSVLLSSLSSSSSRFITFEIGRGENGHPLQTFHTTFTVFASLSVIIVILGETAGLWLLTTKLNIPAGRESAAMWVYQMSVAGAAVAIMQTPFNAVLYGHERFDFSSSIGLISNLLRFGMIALLRYAPADRLIVYAVAMFALGVLSFVASAIYAMKKFPEARPGLKFDWKLLKPILTFSAWETLGTANSSILLAAFPMLVNVLYGVGVNTAIGIGLTVSGAVTTLAFSINTLLKPRIVKLYASGKLDGMKQRAIHSTLMSMIMYGVLAMPLIANLRYVMTLWLGDIPPMAYAVCMVQLAINLPLMGFLVPHETLKSMGYNRGLNIMMVAVAALFFAVTYLIGRAGAAAIVAYTVFQLNMLVKLVWANGLLARRLGWRYVLSLQYSAVWCVIFAEGIVLLVLLGLVRLTGDGPVALILSSVLSVALFTIAASCWLFPADVRMALRGMMAYWLRCIAKPLTAI